MKRLQHSLRVLVVAGSFTGFLGGWAMIAHAGKPAQPGADPQPAAAALVAPAPGGQLSLTAPPGSGQTSSRLQPLPRPQVRSFSGRLRSGGS